MKYLVTSSEMKEYDSAVINKIGIPGSVLMERAALGAADLISEELRGPKKVLILVGCGNNGGDGLALARLLSERGDVVTVFCPGNQEKATTQWKQERKILYFCDVNFVQKLPDGEYDVYVDAFFGVGLSRKVEEPYVSAIEDINQRKGLKVALDLPSGVNTDNGSVLGCAFRADLTVTFGFEKRGLYFYPGCRYAGRIVCVDIGIDEKSFFGKKPQMFYLDESAAKLLPARDPSGNKGTFGKALIVAGSQNMAGAAILCAKACYRTGAGLVKIISCEENRIPIQSALLEALFGSYADLEESLNWADVVAVGPGLSRGDEARKVLETVLEHSAKPLVLDADGLNLLAEDPEIGEKLIRASARCQNIVLTPHVGELSRISGVPAAKLKENLSGYAMQSAEKYHTVVVAKDARTYICKEKTPVCVNIRGTSGMASAGSGDALCGVILGLMAQKMAGFEAACAGVYLHALAGEEASKEKGEYGMMAGDLIEKIGKWKS